MTEHADQLREAFESHETMAPESGAVYARVQELSKKYRKRRLGYQVAGGAVLSAGLVAGVVGLQGLAAAPESNSGSIVAAAPAVSPSTAPSFSDEQAYEAYFDAGYDYLDAPKLAKLWNMDETDIGPVKIAAGKKLLVGETLPFAATPDDNEAPAENEITPEQQKQFDAFFESGYAYEDAEKLATIWKMDKDDIGAVKLAAGKKLLAGETLPVKPSPENVAAAKEAKKYNAFWAAGYTYEDAEKLADIWKLDSAGDAKAEGGKRLLAGKELPVEPSGRKGN